MATIASPNIDFTLNTPGNRIPQSASAAVGLVQNVVIVPDAGGPVTNSPKASVLSSGGGGGGSITYSTPITG